MELGVSPPPTGKGPTMAATLTAPPDRERTASRLLASSAKLSYDPEVDVDWDQPWVDGLYFTSPESSSLYGTPLWDAMSGQQRIDLTRHEVASVASAGIWFETILSRLLLRNVQNGHPTSDHMRYALTEVGDECRHSVMFSRLIDYLDTPYYAPHPINRRLGELFTVALADRAVAFAGTLYVEEILDILQRRAMDDDRVQPVCRQVNTIHVVEEARHMTYARQEMARQWQAVPRWRRGLDRALLGLVGMLSTDELISPAVYRNVGLDIGEAIAARNANPHWAATRRDVSRSVVGMFEELGMVATPSRAIWKLAHLG
jgi:hypothetical protein